MKEINTTYSLLINHYFSNNHIASRKEVYSFIAKL